MTLNATGTRCRSLSPASEPTSCRGATVTASRGGCRLNWYESYDHGRSARIWSCDPVRTSSSRSPWWNYLSYRKFRALHLELGEPRACSVRARGPAEQGSELTRLMMQGTLFEVLQY